jgi:FAD/FMN-containing dehydrogenase
MTAIDEIEAFRSMLGDAGVVTSPDLLERYVVDQRDLIRGATPAVLRPSSTEEVQRIVRLAAKLKFGLVPQAGNTGYCGGATPDMSGRQLVVSLERMNRIREVDRLGHTLSADAGVILADAQKAAQENGLMLALSLGSEGSCRLGGNVGTNAGGLSVLRYGMTRDLVMGLEVVLANGDILDDMRKLRKNNTGYDLKQNFIGSEGTLGIVTGVVLKLGPYPRHRATAWVELAADAPVAEMLALTRQETADLVSSFEFITANSIALVRGPTAGPLKAGTGGALLIELSSSATRLPLDDLLSGTLELMVERGWVEDALIAQGDRQRLSLWALRESIPEGEKKAGGSVKHDISLPLGAIETFLARGGEAVRAYDPALRLSVYGHVGDGNLHYNVLVPDGEERLAFTAKIEGDLSHRLYAIALELGGTYSGEHGVARLKRKLLERYGDPARLALMRRVKTAHDPDNVMNPGALLEPG